MRSTLDELLAGVSALRAYIEGIQLERKLLAAASANPPCSESDRIAVEIREKIGTGSTKRRFDYNSIVISLYGLFEQFVEQLIRSYAMELRGVARKYSDLPKTLCKAHRELSVELIPKLEFARYAGTLNVETVVGNLHSCLSDASDYSLNLEALHQHAANFRAETVNSTFARIGIENVSQRLPRTSSMAAHLKLRYPERDLSSVLPEDIYAPLNDLAERRNEVAHGNASDLLSNEILLDYVQHVESYCQSLYELVSNEALAFETTMRGLPLGTPLEVFNHSIICLVLANQEIKVGDYLVAETGRPEMAFVGGMIEDIQLENVFVPNVPRQPSVKVGCRVSFRTKTKYPLFLLVRP